MIPLLFASLLGGTGGPGAAHASPHILVANELTVDHDIREWKGEQWAVVQDQSCIRVMKVHVRFETATLPPPDEAYDGIHLWKIRIDAPGKALFLFSGVPDLGPKTSVQELKEQRDGQQFNVHGAFGSSLLQISCNYQNPTLRHAIKLSYEGHSQSFAQLRPWDSLSVVWAGDLDGDGRPDVLIKTTDDNSAGNEYRLYLSSKSKGGSLVGFAAGCSDGVGE